MNLTISETIKSLHETLRDYIEATYHISHPALVKQRRNLLNELGVIYQRPFLESTPRYRSGARFGNLGLHPGILKVFSSVTAPSGDLGILIHDPPYQHQSEATQKALVDGRSLVIMTGTGSGKTECFLLPILGKLAREANVTQESFGQTFAVRCLVLYPMNALVNDQLGRLRLLFGDPRITKEFIDWSGRPARFARYTSRTLYPGVRDRRKDQLRLQSIGKFYVDNLKKANLPPSPEQKAAEELVHELQKRGKWPAKPDLPSWFGEWGSRWQDSKTGKFLRGVTLPLDPELVTRHEVQEQPPDILITNYSMLEYMLMRPLERPIFDHTREWLKANPTETFLLVLDEAHLYRGAAGAEVALLIRRLCTRLEIPPERLQVICTSASFSNNEYAAEFGAQLTGKDVAEFETIQGDLLKRQGASPGSSADAEALSRVDLSAFYDRSNESEGFRTLEAFLSYRGIDSLTNVESTLYEALVDFPPMAELVNITMGKALPIDGLGGQMFPEANEQVASRAVTALLALGSVARRDASEPGLLPCRVHAFYRGLAGLWACIDPECTELLVDQRGGPTGKLYSQPRDECDCGARVLELYTCRNCGTAYARAYTDDVDQPDFVWPEAGQRILTHVGASKELEPLDLLLEEPTTDLVEPADYDLVTGRLNPYEFGPRTRRVFLRNDRTAPGSGGDESINARRGEFVPCAVCGESAPFGQTSVQDHQTKGDQPFQTLVAKQIQVQPPSPTKSTTFAPLRGRKVLVFSDSRQTAARLAPNLQTYSTRDALRPLVVYGLSILQHEKSLEPFLSLEDLFLAVMVAVKRLDVRLRPELLPGEGFDAETVVSEALNNGAFDSPPSLIQLLMKLRGMSAPQSLLKAITYIVSDRYYGLESLALASITETPEHSKKLASLPDLPGFATSPDQKLALVRAWLRCWSTTRKGFWLSSMPLAWWNNLVRGHTGKFRAIERYLSDKTVVQAFNQDWLPQLLSQFTETMGVGSNRLKGTELTMLVGGEWSYCQSCRSVQRPFPGMKLCIDCRHGTLNAIDPDTDTVFKARKGYYRISTNDVLKTPPTPPIAIIAAEHTAQLNMTQDQDIFSKAEENELLFQDMDIESSGSPQGRVAIDVLSSTTTMEVGIDIGTLSGVALRNTPPARANYQQRAGRAGRRGNAVATVIGFGSADSHDEHYFSNPEEMISGDVDDPRLTLDNPEIAQRHITAYLLQRYHQDMLPSSNAKYSPHLFAVLGSVSDFKNSSKVLNRDSLKKWLLSNESQLKEGIGRWLPAQIDSEDREKLLANFVNHTVAEIDRAVAYESDADESLDQEPEPEVQAEERVETPASDPYQKFLLDRLLYKGVLPRYAFPTDVATFYVFDRDKSTSHRHIYQFTPSQGLPIALSQYAPGKEVWIGGKEWRSGALYSPMKSELFDAWRDRGLYYECSSCHFARTEPLVSGEKGQLLDCPACGGGKTFGEACYWLRPPGFAHRVEDSPGTSVDDQPARSYATRAKLTNPAPVDDGAWQALNSKIRVYPSRPHLLVTNRGPRDEGYTYCTKCGLIEPTALIAGKVSQGHDKPYPDEREQRCKGGGTTRGLVLGTDFITDVLLISLKIDPPVNLRPGVLSTVSALRTLSEVLALAGSKILELDAGELQAEFRPALTELGRAGQEVEIYIYDTLPGGAGFARRVGELGLPVFATALEILDNCPELCDRSCYRCLRSYKNKFDHDLLDRHLGSSLMRYLLTGNGPVMDERRLERSTDLLFQDLERQAGTELTFDRNKPITVAGLPEVIAPIFTRRKSDGADSIICLHNPLTPNVPANPSLMDIAEYSSVPVFIVDELVVRRNLPSVTTNLMENIG